MSAMKDNRLTTADRRFLRSLLTDLIIFIVLGIPILICEFVLEPFRRGFFCDDESIRYPFRPNTITTVMLGVIVLAVPALIMLLVELTLFYRCDRIRETVLLLGYKVPAWLVEFAQHALYFTFGGLLTLEATEIGKFTIGRLRPHFISVCQPQLSDGSNCESPQNLHRYIENYICVGSGYTSEDVWQARLSFPSGHSSLCFFALTYVAIYLQYKITWRGSKLTRHFLQFTLVMLAWFTALSRIMDNWHHWSDVLCGGLLGLAMALITARYITKEFKTPQACLRVELPRQDTCTTLNEIVPTPPPYTLGHDVDGSMPSLQRASNGSNTQSFSNEQYCSKV
ncbi:putative phosphatidate phosphatase [Bactrocera tryoni]|uniref:putative phosphatidate phosphatase n=1 Tax=Bactrocera tryoni TaxID=59916 RepID=UPI001A9911A5|nr:putative phosphatidate phosphatase [Bactrocera tryoni]